MWHDFGDEPVTEGHEQRHRRPAVVVSNEIYNGGGMCVIAPITSNLSGYPFKVAIPKGTCSVEGAIIADQLRTIDWKKRGYRGTEGDLVPKAVINRVVALYKSVIEDA